MKRAAALFIAVFIMSVGHCAAQGQDYGIEKSLWGDVYFGTLSAELDDKAMTAVEGLYGWLKEHPGSRVLLAGYDDQRTQQKRSVELGWERANAVRDYLVKLGLDGSAVQTISFGNTKVALPGEGEEVWSKNRRVRYRVVPAVEEPVKMEGRPSGVCQKCKK